MMSEQTQAIVEILVDEAAHEGAGPVGRAIERAVGDSLTNDPAYQPLWSHFKAHPNEQAPVMVGVLEVIMDSDESLARRLETLLNAYQRSQGGSTQINTGGGAHIGGNVDVQNGNFTGRDSVTITGDGNVVGDHSQATVVRQEGLGSGELAALFEGVYRAIEVRPPDADLEKEEAVEVVEKIEAEAAKGEAANPRKVERWLRTLAMMGDDIVDVTTACLLNPVAGVATVIKKIAAKAREEAGVSET
jgi:hypothetical protein